MIVKFNPSGTHIHNGCLKVRLDLYPEPDDKVYDLYSIDVLDKKGRPTGEKTSTPCLLHFVKVDVNTILDEAFIKQVFDSETISQLDNAFSVKDIRMVGQVMRAKCGTGKQVSFVDVSTINTYLTLAEVKV